MAQALTFAPTAWMRPPESRLQPNWIVLPHNRDRADPVFSKVRSSGKPASSTESARIAGV